MITLTLFRSGFACIVGRPNVGKSTLLNAMIGSHLAITSDRPQTTRHAIRGVVHDPAGQVVVIDTPGLHRPRTLLGRRLNDLVRATWGQVDVLAQCFPADQAVGPGDRLIARESAAAHRGTRFAVVTKTDRVDSDTVARRLLEVQQVGIDMDRPFDELVPVSAVTGDQVSVLTELLIGALPEGPPLYPEGQITEEPERILIAELIRETALAGMTDELPHSIAVVVEDLAPREDRPEDDPLIDVTAFLFVERESQKAIVIGAKGAGIRRIGTESRRRIEDLLGTRVFLDLRVKVARDWQRDPKQMNRLGF
ncbi:MAG: GTPase Era [Candidatus Nanopelagicales bacterium]